MTNLEQYDISLEEFDSLAGTHVFSKKYNDNKKKMLREYRKYMERQAKNNGKDSGSMCCNSRSSSCRC